MLLLAHQLGHKATEVASGGTVTHLLPLMGVGRSFLLPFLLLIKEFMSGR